MRLYAELAPWFHLLSDPRGYAGEAAHIVALAEAACKGRPESLLELGAGGGCNASHLKRRFTCTLSDLSPEMLEVSRGLNPDCAHLQGDMRGLRLGRVFDVVLVQDAIGYMVTEHDLAAALATVAAHLRPGGVAILIPDETSESFAPGTRHGGNDGADGRALRYLEWSHPAAAGATTYEADYVLILRAPGQPPRVELDRHVFGLFPRATWFGQIRAAGLEPIETDIEDPYAGERVVFVARAPSAPPG